MVFFYRRIEDFLCFVSWKNERVVFDVYRVFYKGNLLVIFDFIFIIVLIDREMVCFDFNWDKGI